jgi:hypothetical protein
VRGSSQFDVELHASRWFQHGFQEESQMRRIWSYGLMLALTGCVSSGGAAPDSGTYTYVDLLRPHGHARGEAAEQAATRACDGGNPQFIGTATFNRCMRGRGWRFTHFEPAPAEPDASWASTPDYSSPPPPPPEPPPPPPPYIPVAPYYNPDGSIAGYM